MYIQYADDKTLCNFLAKYKVRETVIALSDINCDGGVIEKNTKLQITQIRINPNIFIPKILENKLNEYVSTYDEYTFIYKLKPCSSNVDEKTIELSSSEFERADNFTKDFAAQYHNKKKNKRVAATKMWIKATLIILTMVAIVPGLIGLSFIQLIGTLKGNIIVPFFAGFIITFVLASLLFGVSSKISSMFKKAIYYHCIRKVR